jgi:hypothetical protein
VALESRARNGTARRRLLPSLDCRSVLRPAGADAPWLSGATPIARHTGEAKEIVAGRMQSGEALAKAEEREKKWRAYNTELLARMFTSDEYADGFKTSRASGW